MNNPSNQISAELQTFIAKYVHSVEQLEILCLFANNPGGTLSETEVYQKIQSSQQSVSASLRQFAEEGFLAEMAGAYKFSPNDAALGQKILELARIYRERPVAIVEAIYMAPPDPIRHFADAFRMRKDKQ